MKDFYKENYKNAKKKKLKRTPEDGKKIPEIAPCSLTGRINVKMAILPKVFCKFNAIPIKVMMIFFTEPVKTILNPNDWDSQSNPKQKERRLRHHNTYLQSMPQSLNNKNSMVLA